MSPVRESPFEPATSLQVAWCNEPLSGRAGDRGRLPATVRSVRDQLIAWKRVEIDLRPLGSRRGARKRSTRGTRFVEEATVA
jgi:hypothetical protein